MSTIGELAGRTGIDRGEVTELLNTMREKGWVKVRRPNATGTPCWELTDKGKEILPPSTPEGYASIGGREAQELALGARDFYLSKGWFFALALQDTKTGRRVDCVALDYESNTPIAVEIESSEHVLHDHAEQVKRHMLEITPFREVHFWAHGEAAERILELRSQLRPEDQARVMVYAVREEPLRS
jgi:DNA-binding MarR family transcriptional regulator